MAKDRSRADVAPNNIPSIDASFTIIMYVKHFIDKFSNAVKMPVFVNSTPFR